MWGIIVTWRITVGGVTEGTQMLKSGGDAGDAIESAIREVEDSPYYKPVGCGGLPNEETKVGVDAAFMDGSTLDIDAIATIRGFANPVSIVRCLSHGKVSGLLMAEGAEEFAHKEGFGRRNMLTDRAKAHYRKHVREMSARVVSQKLKPYSGHNTVGIACLDMTGKMTAATSTSGLFMRKKGRVGDPPVSGSGFYAGNKKSATNATGLGEGLVKGCISCEIIRLIGEGMHPQEACETTVSYLDVELRERRGEAGDLSIVAMNPKGGWDMATNIKGSSFAVVAESREPAVYLVTRQEGGRCTYKQASSEWMENYVKTRIAPIEE